MTAGLRYGLGVALTAVGVVVASAGLVALVTPGLGEPPRAVAPIDLDETSGPTTTVRPEASSDAGRGDLVADGPSGPAATPSEVSSPTQRAGQPPEGTAVAAVGVVRADPGTPPPAPAPPTVPDTPEAGDPTPGPDPTPEPSPGTPTTPEVHDEPEPDPAARRDDEATTADRRERDADKKDKKADGKKDAGRDDSDEDSKDGGKGSSAARDPDEDPTDD